ncbi:MAG: hypothetical protein WD595_05205 [Waddliaceae bacterium]
MKRELFILSVLLILLQIPSTYGSQSDTNTQESISFTPPKGWHLADKKDLPPSVEFMVIGNGSPFPPSINLATESFSGSMEDYLGIVKKINQENRSEWKRLGQVQTKAGKAELSEAIQMTQWGQVKMMHAMFIKNGTMHILSAAALKDEFPKFYQEFFAAIRSLEINK